jgi:hypothetical protein
MKKITRKQVLIIAVLTVLILSVSGYLLVKARNSDPAQPSSIITTDSSINYGPPTEEEKAQAEKHKEDLTGQMAENSESGSSGKKQITPVITNASQSGQDITVNAYIEGIFENGGTCTVTFTKGSQKITKTTESSADASTTNCKPLMVGRSEFNEPGDWQVLLTYSSSTAEGTSQIKMLTIK